MQGTEEIQDAMFSYISAEQRVPKDHPLRAIRQILRQRKTTLNTQHWLATGRS